MNLDKKSTQSETKRAVRIVVIGEMLIDQLPDGARPGGAPFNFAIHLHRMGFDVQLLSAVGDDVNGHILLDMAKSFGLDTQWISIHKSYPTGTVRVSLDAQGIPSYNIVENVAYDYIDFDRFNLNGDGIPDVLYFGSLVQRTETGRKALTHFLDQLPSSVHRVYDMNIRTGCDCAEIILQSLARTDILKLNEEELVSAAVMMGLPNERADIDRLATALTQYYDLDEIIVTRGSKGSILYKDGERYEVPAGDLKEDEIIDTVGAGDAFAAAYVGNCLKGASSADALRNASAFADRICATSGAIPSDESFYTF